MAWDRSQAGTCSNVSAVKPIGRVVFCDTDGQSSTSFGNPEIASKGVEELAGLRRISTYQANVTLQERAQMWDDLLYGRGIDLLKHCSGYHSKYDGNPV